MILAGDVGGTKSYLAIFSSKDGCAKPIAEGLFASKEFTAFSEMVRFFLSEHSVQPLIASIGVAGPVIAGEVDVTKLAWHISEAGLKREFGFNKVFLLNDLAAVGYAIPFLTEADLDVVHHGVLDESGVAVVVAPGTGLGETFITRNGAKPVVHASEGGHCLFGPATSLQIGLLNYGHELYGQVTYDLLCSGPGIPIIYDFLRIKSPEHEPAWLTARLQGGEDRTPVIVEAAKNNGNHDSVARAAIEMFVDILAEECANFSLKTLASGGVYLAGGMPVRIREFLQEKSFMAAFCRRHPFKEFLEKIPITMITNPKAALIGAASVALERMNRRIIEQANNRTGE